MFSSSFRQGKLKISQVYLNSQILFISLIYVLITNFSSKFSSTCFLAFFPKVFTTFESKFINFSIAFTNDFGFCGSHKKPLKLSIIILLHPGTLVAILGLPKQPSLIKSLMILLYTMVKLHNQSH